jgi:hypothetical protein
MDPAVVPEGAVYAVTMPEKLTGEAALKVIDDASLGVATGA